MSITSFILKGHQNSVNCLDSHLSEPLLLSGSDDKTARLWDLRSSKASLCIRAEDGIASVVLGLPNKDELIEPIDSPFAMNYSVFLSVGNNVFEYDLRQNQTPITQQHIRDLSEEMSAYEEVNQLSVSSRRIVAAADDGGSVCIWDGQRSRKLQPSDSNFLMTCCRFRSGDQLASGGTNCSLYLWDIGRPNKPVDVFQIQTDDTGANQVCNPPMVHTLSWSPSGRLLAAGLGDGSIHISSVVKKKLVSLARLRDGHSDSVVSLCFPNFSSNHKVNTDRLLASAGTDGAILLWDLNQSVGGKASIDPRDILAKELLEEQSDENPNNNPKLIFGIPHRSKANWIVSNRATTSLYVADTSNDITAYSIPLIS